MKEPNRILFVSQEIYPFLDQETPIRLLNRKLPEWFHASGCETRTFMPKFGDINECRMPMMLLEWGVSVTAREVMLLMSISSRAWVTIASWWMCLNEWVIISAAVRFFRFS